MAGSTQGQSPATIDKERRIASALSIGMRIANARFGGKGFRYWHFDANAGSGWNGDFDVPGSPLVFHAMADQHLGGMRREAFFCELNGETLGQLAARLGRYAGQSTLLPGDNDIALDAFAERIRQAEKPSYAVGSVIVDPNGYWYRNAENKGASPVKAMLRFVAEFPRIDVVLNLNMRIYRLQKSRNHSVLPPRAVLGSLNKKHWLVSEANRGGRSFLLAVGRNTPTGDHRQLQLYRLGTPDADHILSRVVGGRQSALPLPSSDTLTGYSGHV